MKKTLITLLIVVLLWGAGYVYWSSQQKPTDTTIATDTTNTQTQPTNDTPAMVDTGSQNTGDVATGEVVDFSVAQNSKIGWKATKAGGEHYGKVNIIDGFMAVQGNHINGGEFTMDMTSITMEDSKNAKLEGEIKNKFFEADKYPTSKFVLTKTEFDGVKTIVYGDLTIKDKTKPIQFPATITYTPDSVHAVASFAIDRQLWDLTVWNGIVNNFLEFNIDLTRQKAF